MLSRHIRDCKNLEGEAVLEGVLAVLECRIKGVCDTTSLSYGE
jgi:hypothetical protein